MFLFDICYTEIAILSKKGLYKMEELSKIVKKESLRTLIWTIIACGVALGVYFTLLK